MTSPRARLRLFATHVLPTLPLAAVAGAAAASLDIPLPWMIGPLFLVAAVRMGGFGLAAPRGGRQLGQWAIGAALGLYFSPAVVAQLGAGLGVIAAIAGGAVAFGMVGALLMLRWGRVDAPTAFFASLPGGASEMATLAERCGGAVDRVAAAHALRVMLVVAVVPGVLIQSGAHGSDLYTPLARSVDWQRLPLLLAASLAGVAILGRLRVANAWVLGALAGVAAPTAAGVTLSALPAWVINGGQLLIGCSLGARFSPEFFRAAPRFMAVAAAGGCLAMLLAGGLAWMLSRLAPVPLATLALAAAPGGIAEMSITAKVLQLGVPLVTAAHVMRVVVLTLSAPYACRLFVRLAGRAAP